MGTPVKILKDEGSWILVQTPNRYIGWAYAYELQKLTSDEINAYKQSEKKIYASQSGFSYSEANIESRVVSDLALGCMFSVIDSVGDFYKVQYADKRNAFVKKNETISVKAWLKREPIAENLIKTAEKFMGLPYLWGGTSSKAIDCSGFSSSIYFMHGILLQRDASQQTHYGKLVDTHKDFTQLQAGDLVFFGRQATDSLPEKVTHVGMYIGDTEFIHASGKVRINSFDASRTNYGEDYVKSFIRARRIIQQVDNKGIERIENNLFYKEIF
jgi:cell wall-associated NlpC family hydrolase